MKKSAGILVYRRKPELQVLLVHPGGPFFLKKNEGVWSIPKGEFEDGEDPLSCALRELEEETGLSAKGDCKPLGHCKLKSGKLIYAWALEHDFDLSEFRSNTFEMEWPPKSGKKRTFPEADKAAWLNLPEAAKLIHPMQQIFLKRMDLGIEI